ncbi:MAG: nucleotidyltransferase [Chloroflexi bacterium]|nr:nucleotidyltransferase [Chloroflexota bacterium]
MAEREALAPLLAALRDLVAWLKATGVPGMVIGGVAAAFLGRPRVTRDVDAVVLLDAERWEEFLARGAEFGFAARRPDALAFARRAGVLLVRHEPSAIDVDIAFGALPFEREAVARAGTVKVGDVDIPLPTPEDLIVMKAVAHRPRDVADIEAILDVHPNVDLRRVRRWVRSMAAVLEMPEIARDLETIVARWRKRKT